jgi:hypothetical protein
MLSIQARSGGETYTSRHLSVDDYYSEHERVPDIYEQRAYLTEVYRNSSRDGWQSQS